MAGNDVPAETNPMMGVRGVHQLVVHARMADAQISALLVAAVWAGLRPGQLRLLVPMVADARELAWVRALLERCCTDMGLAVPQLG